MTSNMDPARFIQLLRNVLESDTTKVKEATAILKRDYYKKPESLSLLLQLLTSDETPQLRQLAATQARSLIARHWDSVPEANKPQIRSHLLTSTLQEQNSLVRHAESRVISTIAKLDVDDGQWAELPGLMEQAASSGSVQEREVSTYILFTVLETMGDGFMPRFSQLFELFSKTIQDPESAEVRINTMLALSKMALMLDADNDEGSLEAIQQLLPAMVEVLKAAIQANDEEKTMQAFEVFQTLLECDSKILNPHFSSLIQFMAQVSANKAINKDARTQALNFLIAVLMYRKLKFQSLRIGDRMTMELLQILVDGDGNGSNDDDDELSLTLAALSLLSVMSSNLPPSQIMVPLIREFNTWASSSDPKRKVAIISALGTCVEGAPDFLDSQLKGLLPAIIRLLNDPSIKVREAACSGTKLLADQLCETMCKEHEAFITSLGKNLNLAMQDLSNTDAKTSISIVVHCCSAIDSLFDGLADEDVQRYLPDLVPHLSKLFSHPEIKIKAAAIGAVGSIAQCAKAAFRPYFQDSMNALGGYIRIKDSEDELDLRSMTTDAMGNIALAVGPEAFQPYVQGLMEATEEALHLDTPQLKETSYMFWGTIAKVYEGQFEPFLPGTLKGLIACIEQEEADLEVELGQEASDLLGQEVVIAGKRVKVVSNDHENEEASADFDIDAEADEEDDDDDDAWDDLAAVSAIAEEKEIALEALAEIIYATKEKFVPYFEKTIELVMPIIEHPYESTRRAAISMLFRAYATLFEMQAPKSPKWKAGLPLEIQPVDAVMQFGSTLMTATLAVWQSEDDRGVVIEINRNIAETLKLCGPAILSGDDVVKNVTTIILSIITKKHACQQELSDDEDDINGDEASEDDWFVVESALDVMTTMAGALGPQFGELWKMFDKTVLGYASGTEHTQRAAAVGAIADAIRGMSSGITPFTSGLLKLLLHRMSDEDPLTKSNAAFATGLLVEHSDNHQIIVKAYNTILAKLTPLLEAEEARQLDNAAGCVSRMIFAHQDHIPLDDVLPALVKLLPLKEDYEENEPVFHMIMKLYNLQEPTIQRLTPQVVPILAHVLADGPAKQVVDETRAELIELVKYIRSKQPGLVQENAVLMSAIAA